MSLTLREIWQYAWLRWGVAWLLFVLLASTLGPFGTFELLPLGPRLGYWALVLGLSMGLEALRRLLGGWDWTWQWRLASHLPYAAVLGVMIVWINWICFGVAASWAAFGFLFSVILIVALGVEGVLLLLSSGPTEVQNSPQPEPPSDDWLMGKLAVEKRGPLVRLEAQDHYTLVVTEAGQDLLLLRFGDVVERLGSGAGQRVHRSHWVAKGAVRHARNQNGRDTLLMADESEVPVSRSFRAAAKQAGLI